MPTTLRSLYELRLHAGFRSQRQIAARLGMSGQNYGLIERGYQNPTPAMFKRLAYVLRVSQALLAEVLERAPHVEARRPVLVSTGAHARTTAGTAGRRR